MTVPSVSGKLRKVKNRSSTAPISAAGRSGRSFIVFSARMQAFYCATTAGFYNRIPDVVSASPPGDKSADPRRPRAARDSGEKTHDNDRGNLLRHRQVAGAAHQQVA